MGALLSVELGKSQLSELTSWPHKMLQINVYCCTYCYSGSHFITLRLFPDLSLQQDVPKGKRKCLVGREALPGHMVGRTRMAMAFCHGLQSLFNGKNYL